MTASKLCSALAFACVLAAPSWALAQAVPSASRDERIARDLEHLKAMRQDLAREMQDFDARIDDLELEMKGQAHAQSGGRSQPAVAPAPVVNTASPRNVAPTYEASPPAEPAATPNAIGVGPRSWGGYDPFKGFVLVRTDQAELSVTLISYVRYLNQLSLDHSYTDSFGRTFDLDLRQDILLNKINLTFKGWLFNPDFTYRAWIWTQNPAMGQGAQVVVAGHIAYRFNDYLNLAAGVSPLPSTRSTNWTYPLWLRMDNRTVADEFFRASYTMGVWAEGKLADDVGYRAMLANNLSTLGVSADQLDPDLGTFSGAIWWMPTTGEFGPALGFGDYDDHQALATMFGIHYTRSREDKQSQPGVNDFENSQIRLSDGTQIFSPDAFNTGGQINLATYQMLDLNAGLKYRGISLEWEYYARWVDSFKTTGSIPITDMFDQGYQVQASAMLIPKVLQLYASNSKVFGQFGKPWDFNIGLNWYPFKRRQMHINTQTIYLRHSPVGGLSYPYVVGGNGWLFNTDVIVTF